MSDNEINKDDVLAGFENVVPFTPDPRDEIAELAKLDDLDYEAKRSDAAVRLNMRTSVLDAEVKKARPKEAKSNSKLPGQDVEFPEPEPWPGPIDGGMLAFEIRDALRRHVCFQDSDAEKLALWTFIPHTFDAWSTAPSLGIVSPEKECGKSTLLDVLSFLVPKPCMSSNQSPAVFFRLIDEHRPTALMDETDTYLDQKDELRGLLNSAQRKSGAFSYRCIGDNSEVRAFSTWAPMVMACIGQLPDTLDSRAIKITLHRRRDDEPIADLDETAQAGLDTLRRMAWTWGGDHLEILKMSRPALPTGIINRQADSWRPMLAIAQALGGEWPDIARDLAINHVLNPAQRDRSKGEELLVDILAAFEGRGNPGRMSSSDLIIDLCAMDGARWASYRNGRPMDATGMSRILKTFDIRSRDFKFSSKTKKGYELAWFEQYRGRYFGTRPSPNPGHPPSQPATPQLSNEFNGFQGSIAATLGVEVAAKKPDNPLKPNDSCGVAATDPPDGPLEGFYDVPPPKSPDDYQ